MKGFISKGKYALLALLMLFYIGLHIFMQQHNYTSSDTLIRYLIWIVFGVSLVTLFYFVCIDMGIWKDAIEEDEDYVHLLVLGQMILFSVIVLLQMKVSDQGFWLTSKEIYFFGYAMPKKYLFDLVIIIFFPVSVASILNFAGIRHNVPAKITGILEILLLNIMGYFLFYGLGYIWLVNMAVLNIITVSAALHHMQVFANRMNGDRIACVILCLLLHIILLAVMKKGGVDLCSSLYQGDWDNYQGCVRKLMEGADFWGQSHELRLMSRVQEVLLCGHGNFIHSLLYYFGWSSVVIYLLTLAAFVGCLRSLLRPVREREDLFCVVYQTAFWNLMLRIVLGVLYSFAIVPFPIALPFAGKVGLVADACCVALLVYHRLGGVIDETFLLLYEEE